MAILPQTRHGVLTSEGVFHSWDTHYATQEIENVPGLSLEGLMYVALQGKFTHLLIHSSSGLAFTREQAASLLDTQRWDVGPQGKFVSVQKQGRWKGYITSIVGRSLKPYPTPNTRLIFIEQGNWPLDDATPEQLLSTASSIESTLGVAMAGSPTSVGLRYLEKMNTRYYQHYFEKSNEVDWEALKMAHVPAHAWFPPVGMDEAYKPYLHCFDRNSSHPFAASSENMGVGTPFVQEGGEFDKRKVGLWDVEVSGGKQVSSSLPPLFPKARYWLPTPLLRIATMYGGYTVSVNRAFLWPEGKPIFERWAKALWEFREQFPDTSMERKAVKSIMNNPIGATRIGEDMDSTLRPDWYALIVGAERAVVWYKAWKLGGDSNVYPCGCYADALYYLSFSDDHRKAVPGMLNAEKSLGGYKAVPGWPLRVDDVAREVLRSNLAPNMRIAELKKLMRRQHG